MLSVLLAAATIVCSGGGSTPIACTGTEHPPTPAESAAILAPYQFVYVPPPPNGPTVVIVPSESWPSLDTGWRPWPPDFGRPLGTGGECYGFGCAAWPVYAQPFSPFVNGFPFASPQLAPSVVVPQPQPVPQVIPPPVSTLQAPVAGQRRGNPR